MPAGMFHNHIQITSNIIVGTAPKIDELVPSSVSIITAMLYNGQKTNGEAHNVSVFIQHYYCELLSRQIHMHLFGRSIGKLNYHIFS